MLTSIDWLRLIFPSWRFFESFGEVPVLFHCESIDGIQFDDWKRTLPIPRRRWWNLFINGEGNQFFVCQSLIQKLVGEINSANDVSQVDIDRLTSFHILRKIVEDHLQPKNRYYRIRISHVETGSLNEIVDHHLETNPYEVKK